MGAVILVHWDALAIGLSSGEPRTKSAAVLAGVMGVMRLRCTCERFSCLLSWLYSSLISCDRSRSACRVAAAHRSNAKSRHKGLLIVAKGLLAARYRRRFAGPGGPARGRGRGGCTRPLRRDLDGCTPTARHAPHAGPPAAHGPLPWERCSPLAMAPRHARTRGHTDARTTNARASPGRACRSLLGRRLVCLRRQPASPLHPLPWPLKWPGRATRRLPYHGGWASCWPWCSPSG